MAFRVEVSSHWFFQTSMFNIRSVAVHSYVERILCFSNILFLTFYALDHVDHVSRGLRRPSGLRDRVVYVIECIKCKKQYVGETENALHIRMNGHRSDIKHRRLEKPVATHFNSEGHSLEDLSIVVIEQIHREEANFRKAKESHWIQTLRSLVPGGLNLDP